jgi:hypothetical protein
MTHRLDLERTHEQLVLLQHFVHGSNKFCEERLVGSEKDTGDGEFDSYWSWVKFVASSYTLECSIRFRVLLDIFVGKPEYKILKEFDTEVREGKEIGEIIEGKFDLNLRESCNKIIHARKLVPIWSDGDIDGINYKYWSGDLDLIGKKGKNSWRLKLHVSPWADCMSEFLFKAELSGLTSYIGADWL